MPKLMTYVLSRGPSPDHDYCWVKVVSAENIKSEIPQFFGSRLKVTDYIDSQRPSIILAYSDGEYLLLVTALDTSPERTDFMGRRIRNSIAWVAQAPVSDETDRLIRTLAIRALNRELDDPIHKAIDNAHQKSQTGFSVDASKLDEILEDHEKIISTKSTGHPLTFEYAYDNDENRKTIIHDLNSRSLQSIKQTNGTDILLLVTTIKSLQGFEKMEVWRGLSSRVPEESGWVKKKPSSSKRLNERNALMMIFLLIIILIIGIYLYKSNQERSIVPINQESRMQSPKTLNHQELQIEIPVILDKKSL